MFVLDAMIGQDAVTTAEAFRDGVGFTGVVLTKLDGDARGGAALSVREVTGVPILFASTGEKLEDFDVFHPDRMASRILGMGDVLTLIEQAEQVFDAEQAEAAAAKIGSGELTLEDFLEQMLAIRKMGPIGNLLGHAAGRRPDEGRAGRRRRQPPRPAAAIIRGMTPAERADPKIINALAAAAHRQRVGRHGVRGQPARRPVLRGPQDDAPDGRPDGHAVGRKGRRARPRKKSKKGKKGGRGPTPPKARNPLGLPPECPPVSRICPTCPRVSTSCRPAWPTSICRSSSSRQEAGDERCVIPEVARPRPGCPMASRCEWWIVDGVLSAEPVADAETVFGATGSAGSCPAWSTPTATSGSARTARPTTSTRRRAGRGRA